MVHHSPPKVRKEGEGDSTGPVVAGHLALRLYVEILKRQYSGDVTEPETKDPRR